MAAIRLDNISKRWGDFIGVSSFNLDIADTEFLVLLGPSGCGKTTTMRMVAGLEHATEGDIYIGDRLVNKLEPKDRDVAMVFQSYGWSSLVIFYIASLLNYLAVKDSVLPWLELLCANPRCS